MIDPPKDDGVALESPTVCVASESELPKVAFVCGVAPKVKPPAPMLAAGRGVVCLLAADEKDDDEDADSKENPEDEEEEVAEEDREKLSIALLWWYRCSNFAFRRPSMYVHS